MARWQAAGLHHGRTWKQFRRLELNQHPPVFSGTLDLRAAPEYRASGGTRTHRFRLTRAVPDPSSIAGIQQGDRWDSNPRNLVHSQAPESPSGTATESPAGVEPA